MNYSKKISLLLLLAIFVVLMPAKSYAKEPEKEGINDCLMLYESDGTLAGRIQNDTLYAESLSILRNRTEESLAPWYEYRDQIKFISFNTTYPNKENDICFIGQYAFYGLNELIQVSIPSSILTIGSYAFCGCESLEKLSVGENIVKISDSAFENCYKLNAVAFPNTYFTIGYENFDYQDEIAFYSYPGGIAEGYAKYSDSIKFSDATNSEIFEKQYYATKDNAVKIEGMDGNIIWSFNPYTRTIKFNSEKGTIAKITAGNHEWDKLGGAVQTAIVDKYITRLDNSCFSNLYGLTSISVGLDTLLIEDDAFFSCLYLKEVVIYSSFNNLLSDKFFSNIPSGCEVICHYSEEENSVFQTGTRTGCSIHSFEGTERLSTLDTDVSCANQFDGIRNISARKSYYDANGNKVTYVESWASTACVVTSTAMMIERRAYLDGYESTVGSFDQSTAAAIVKEMSFDYILVDYAWQFKWGEHTSTYETLTKNDEPYTVKTNSYDRGRIKEDELITYIDKHPEGVAVFDTQHAVLVTGYSKDEKGNTVFTVWDPATGKEHERYLSKLNGNSGFVLKHIIYIED